MQPKQPFTLEYETFDFEKYKDTKNQYGQYDYKETKEDGTIMSLSSSTPTYGERLIDIHFLYPEPYFYEDYVDYYANGRLKSKGRFGLEACKVGKWVECDEQGNCRIVDYDQNRKFSYEDVLRFLAKRKHIDLKTGRGKDKLYAFYDYEQKIWNVRTGDESWVRKFYVLNGKTGKILHEKILPFVP